MIRKHRRKGIALVEVLAAASVLFIAVAGWLTLVVEIRHVLARVAANETVVQQAASALALASVMPQDSLLAWQRGRPFGRIKIQTSTSDRVLWRIVASDASSSHVILESFVRSRAPRPQAGP
jgi:hypothetical protein